MKSIPGFRFDAKRGVVEIKVIVPGTQSLVRRQATLKAATMQDALVAWKKFRDGVLEEAKSGTPAAEKTLRWYFDTYWEKKMKAGLSDKGASSVEQAMKRILPHLGDTLMERINDAEVNDLVAAMKADDYAAETINGTLDTLRKFLRDAVARETIPTYPIKRRLPRQKVPKLRLELSPEERTAFLAAFDDEARFRELLPEGRRFGVVVAFADGRTRGGPMESKAAAYHFAHFRALKPLFVVALETGLRHADLLTLRWTSVNAKDGWIRVSMGKTKEEAVVAIAAACKAALEECRTRPVRSKEFVFVNHEGAPIAESTLKRAFATAKRLAKIERRFRFHDLRHTFASTLASQGVSLQVIQRALGHTTAKMSERYARPSEDALRTMAEALDRASAQAANEAQRAAQAAAIEPEIGPANDAAKGFRERVTPSEAPMGAMALPKLFLAAELAGGRCGDRTRDLLRVKQTLYR